MEPSTSLQISTQADFETRLNENKGKIVVVHFWAPWSEACKQMQDVADELAKDTELAKFVFLRLEAENVPQVSLDHKINAVPTFIFLQDGQQIGRLDGAYPAELTKKVRQLNSSSGRPNVTKSPVPKATPVDNSIETKEELNERLKKLINAYKCMVFMKGDPEQPRCVFTIWKVVVGFSKQLIEMLNGLNADYKTFDILSDESVRQGLKDFSNWKTYPQLYVKGELLGGLDILREMHEAGELAAALPIKEPLDQRLRALINRDPIMIFMKGDPSGPRCKFSKALMEIMHGENVTFGSFNILEDNDVREGLKKFSNWQTYPQVYVKGELIGGIDIIQELKQTGELKAALKVDCSTASIVFSSKNI